MATRRRFSEEFKAEAVKLVKMRLITALLLATTAMFVASPVGALVITLGDGSASGGVTVGFGELVTIELRMSDDGTQEINGVGASVYGYEPGLTFVSGRAVRAFLTDTNLLRFANSAGIGNTVGGLFSQRVLAQNSIGAFGNRVAVFQALDVNGHFIDPDAVNPGLETNGGVQARLVFRADAVGVYTILADGGYQGDGLVLAGGTVVPYTGVTFAVTVIPEPGTALLMGLGLAGLAAAGRRESSHEPLGAGARSSDGPR